MSMIWLNKKDIFYVLFWNLLIKIARYDLSSFRVLIKSYRIIFIGKKLKNECWLKKTLFMFKNILFC